MKLAPQKSIFLSLALRVCAATSLVCACVFALVYLGLERHATTSITETIDTDLAGLVDIYASQGQAGLTSHIHDRLDLAPASSERPYYLVLGKTGEKLIGNIEKRPSLDAQSSQTGLIKVANGTSLRARVTKLRGGLSLLVGRSDRLSRDSLTEVRNLFLLALALMILSTFFIAQMAAQKLRLRVKSINEVFDALETGNMPINTPLFDRGDELDQLSTHVNKSLDRIKRLLSAQRDVSDNIAHEARTPIMVIEKHIQTAISHNTHPIISQNLDAAQTQIKSLLRLLDALLDIASAEAQAGNLQNLGEINLSNVARSLSELYTASAEEAGIDFICDIQDNVVMRADAMQMSRLLVNLFDNAFKYGSSGKNIHFTLTSGPYITIEDKGPGIADQDKITVFERYRRATSTRTKGHGLGLALVKAIAMRHGLSIRVEDAQNHDTSNPQDYAKNRGARFILSPEVGY